MRRNKAERTQMRLLKAERTQTCHDAASVSIRIQNLFAAKVFVASTADIKEICARWNDIKNFVEIYHPDKAASTRAVYMFNDVVISHFREVKQSKKQIMLDRFFMKRKEPGTTCNNFSIKKIG